MSSLRATPGNSPTAGPARIGIGQLRASPSEYLDRVAAGETMNVIRRGRVVARLQPPTG